MGIKNPTVLNHTVYHQGAVNVDHVYVKYSKPGICAVGIELKSKYAEVIGFGEHDGCPAIFIGATKRTLNLNENFDKDEPIHLALTDFKGWEIWAVDCSRYTIRVCLIKD